MAPMSHDILWAYGHFSETGPNAPRDIEADVENIGPTLFDVVVLPFLHVHEGGALFYNDTPLEQLWDGLPDAFEQLKNGYETKKTLILSLGPFQTDFTYAGQDLGQFVDDVADFVATYNIDGLDLDYEGDYGSANAELVAEIGNAFVEKTSGVLTLAPYTLQDFWCGDGGVLSRTATSQGSNVTWMNVQFYMGSANTPPSDWPGTFQSWADAVASGPNNISAPDAPGFLAPGCNAETFSLDEMSDGVTLVRDKYPGVGGAFVWNYNSIVAGTAAWAQAIRQALGT